MKLRVEHHCIETAARKEYRRVQALLLGLEESTPQFLENAQSLTLLENFLRKTDFSELRTKRPELSGGRILEVDLVEGDGPDEFELRENK